MLKIEGDNFQKRALSASDVKFTNRISITILDNE